MSAPMLNSVRLFLGSPIRSVWTIFPSPSLPPLLLATIAVFAAFLVAFLRFDRVTGAERFLLYDIPFIFVVPGRALGAPLFDDDFTALCSFQRVTANITTCPVSLFFGASRRAFL
jgi:hypothetical protein